MPERPEFKPSRLDRAYCAIAPVSGMRRMAAKKILHEFSYDGARQSTRRNQAPQNTNPNDFSKQRDRLVLLREAEDLENNFAPAKTLNRKYAMYVAPQAYHAQTGDHELDKQVEDYLNNEWFPNCDVTGRFDFFKMLEFGIIGMNRAGDYGWAFMRPGLEDGMTPEQSVTLPFKIQAVEADRIGGIYQNVVSEDYVSGLLLGDYGEVKAYRVFRRGMTTQQYTDPVDVPAAQFVHYTDGMRADMYRPVSKLDAACANLRDLYELLDFIKGKAKLASALTLFTNSQGATQGGGAMDGYASMAFANNQAGIQSDINYGQINHLPNGTEMKFPDSASPGAETQFLILQLLKFVAMTYNLPYSFALDATSLGGVSSRLESEQAKAEFERGQKVLAPLAHRMKNAALFDAIAKGIFPASTASIITKGRWGYRSHPQPDIGKEANAATILSEHGMLDPMQWWIDSAADPERVAASMVRWAKIKRDAATDAGFSVQEVFGNGPAKPVSVTQSESTTVDSSEASGQPSPDSVGLPEGETLISKIGIGGTQSLVQVQQQISSGAIPRDTGINTLMIIFGISKEQAEKLAPAQGSAEIEGSGDAAIAKLSKGRDKEFKATPAEQERMAVIREMVDLLKAKLPVDQAIAAAYKIYDTGKTRAQLIADVKKHLKG